MFPSYGLLSSTKRKSAVVQEEPTSKIARPESFRRTRLPRPSSNALKPKVAKNVIVSRTTPSKLRCLVDNPFITSNVTQTSSKKRLCFDEITIAKRRHSDASTTWNSSSSGWHDCTREGKQKSLLLAARSRAASDASEACKTFVSVKGMAVMDSSKSDSETSSFYSENQDFLNLPSTSSGYGESKINIPSSTSLEVPSLLTTSKFSPVVKTAVSPRISSLPGSSLTSLDDCNEKAKSESKSSGGNSKNRGWLKSPSKSSRKNGKFVASSSKADPLLMEKPISCFPSRRNSIRRTVIKEVPVSNSSSNSEWEIFNQRKLILAARRTEHVLEIDDCGTSSSSPASQKTELSKRSVSTRSPVPSQTSLFGLSSSSTSNSKSFTNKLLKKSGSLRIDTPVDVENLPIGTQDLEVEEGSAAGLQSVRIDIEEDFSQRQEVPVPVRSKSLIPAVMSPPRRNIRMRKKLTGLAGALANVLSVRRSERLLRKCSPEMTCRRFDVYSVARCWGTTLMVLDKDQVLLHHDHRHQQHNVRSALGAGAAPSSVVLATPLPFVQAQASHPAHIVGPLFI